MFQFQSSPLLPSSFPSRHEISVSTSNTLYDIFQLLSLQLGNSLFLINQQGYVVIPTISIGQRVVSDLSIFYTSSLFSLGILSSTLARVQYRLEGQKMMKEEELEKRWKELEEEKKEKEMKKEERKKQYETEQAEWRQKKEQDLIQADAEKKQNELDRQLRAKQRQQSYDLKLINVHSSLSLLQSQSSSSSSLLSTLQLLHTLTRNLVTKSDQKYRSLNPSNPKLSLYPAVFLYIEAIGFKKIKEDETKAVLNKENEDMELLDLACDSVGRLIETVQQQQQQSNKIDKLVVDPNAMEIDSSTSPSPATETSPSNHLSTSPPDPLLSSFDSPPAPIDSSSPPPSSSVFSSDDSDSKDTIGDFFIKDDDDESMDDEKRGRKRNQHEDENMMADLSPTYNVTIHSSSISFTSTKLYVLYCIVLY
jgi:hypothetical protein